MPLDKFIGHLDSLFREIPSQVFAHLCIRQSVLRIDLQEDFTCS